MNRPLSPPRSKIHLRRNGGSKGLKEGCETASKPSAETCPCALSKGARWTVPRLFRLYQQDGQPRFPDDIVGNAAEDQPSQAAAPMSG